LCMSMGVKSYVELGTGSGFFLLDAGVPSVVCVDINNAPDRHNSYEATGVHYLRGNSHDLQTLRDVLTILGGPPDAVFIDADHSYEAVRQDFDMWYPAAKMLIGFHDILIPDVARLWEEISLSITSAKVIGCDLLSARSWQGDGAPADGRLTGGGIGVIFKESV
jgi:hypothetical protein